MQIERRNVMTVPEGDGVEVKRLFPIHGFMNFDPFVLWDHFSLGPGRGFPDHPHRGFEAITYMFAGGMNHKDNLGNDSFVSTGGAQRFTAGKGIVHSEMPAANEESSGIQLWINLPKRLKQIEPAYQQVNAEEFQIKEITGGWVKNIVGDNSPLQLQTSVIYQHIKLQSGASYSLPLAAGMRGIVYLMEGTLRVNDEPLNNDQAHFIEGYNELQFNAETETEFMVCMGLPHGEPIKQYGPYVD